MCFRWVELRVGEVSCRLGWNRVCLFWIEFELFVSVARVLGLLACMSWGHLLPLLWAASRSRGCGPFLFSSGVYGVGQR